MSSNCVKLSVTLPATLRQWGNSFFVRKYQETIKLKQQELTLDYKYKKCVSVASFNN